MINKQFIFMLLFATYIQASDYKTPPSSPEKNRPFPDSPAKSPQDIKIQASRKYERRQAYNERRAFKNLGKNDFLLGKNNFLYVPRPTPKKNLNKSGE